MSATYQVMEMSWVKFQPFIAFAESHTEIKQQNETQNLRMIYCFSRHNHVRFDSPMKFTNRFASPMASRCLVEVKQEEAKFIAIFPN